MKHSKKAKWAIVLCSLIVLFISLPVVAQDSKSGALTLASSVPANGAKDVAPDVTIELLFNKNVANTSVAETNRKAISLKTKAGENVAVEIVIPDDQTNPDQKRNIYVKAKQPLKAGTTYILTIASSFMAKNGMNIDKEHTVTFEVKKK